MAWRGKLEEVPCHKGCLPTDMPLPCTQGERVCNPTTLQWAPACTPVPPRPSLPSETVFHKREPRRRMLERLRAHTGPTPPQKKQVHLLWAIPLGIAGGALALLTAWKLWDEERQLELLHSAKRN